MAPRATPEQKRQYFAHRRKGATQAEAARIAGISARTASAWDNAVRNSSGNAWAAARNLDDLPEPIALDKLSDVARRSLDDFGLFRRRYFGRIPSPWQEEAANRIVELLESPNKEFAVINVPPGTGKSTTFTHDIPAWLTARQRSIRGLIGSRTEKQATQYTARLRRTFDRTIPVQGEEQEIRRGLAFDADATLIADFGRFRTINDLWRKDRFVVAQFENILIDEKEATWTAFGMDGGSLGQRVDFVMWDDLVDNTTLRTIDAIETQRHWWETEAETRLEPAGLLILQGQRLSSRDLYRYCLDMQVPVELDLGDDPDAWDPSDPNYPTRPKYHHIKFPAHFDDRCENNHRSTTARPYPDGCLLDPQRLPWGGAGGLAAIRANKAAQYLTVYQQEDLDPASVLVHPLWISGGRGEDGVDYPGCWDNDRGLCELPRTSTGAIALAPPYLSIATTDPSPTKFWAIQWWIYHPATEQRFLMDTVRQVMTASEFLDRLYPSGEFVGLMEEWWRRSRILQIPITHWIVEKNAAQKFMLQYNHTREWLRARSVNLIPHETGVNKADPELGVESIAPHYRFGRVRLPGKNSDGARIASLKLVDEVTRYPDAATTDQVMAHWFLEWNLPKIHRPTKPHTPARRPSWIRDLVGTPGR